MRRSYKCPYNCSVDCSRRPCQERCSACGHNPIEAARRRGYIQAGGMKCGPRGLLALRLGRESRI